MFHIYTSISATLQANGDFLHQSSHCFQQLSRKIRLRDFKRRDNPGKEFNFTLKEAARLLHKFPIEYKHISTMDTELEFFRQALGFDSGIPGVHQLWKQPQGHP